MTIIQALKTKRTCLRLTTHERYMFWGNADKKWIINKVQEGKIPASLIAMTKDQKTAVEFLLGNR